MNWLMTVFASTRPANATPDGGLSTQWQVALALLAALVGGLLTLAGDLLIRRRSEKAAFRAAMKTLHDEIGRITSAARARETPPVGGAAFAVVAAPLKGS